MTVTRYPSGLAVGGGATGASSAGVVCALRLSFDPTSVSQVALGVLPAGAIPIDIIGYGGATGGTNPTVDIGTVGSAAGFANELDADAGGTSASSGADFGALMNVQVTAETIVYGNVGASAATGGTFKGAMLYIVEDL